jgi:hypothetical protein
MTSMSNAVLGRCSRNDENLRVKPTTPTFLSEVDAAPETKPVVYSPVPTIRTAGGAIVAMIFPSTAML